MTQYLPPNLLALFQAREPIPYLPPTDKLSEEKPECKYGGVSRYVNFFESKGSSSRKNYPESKQERHDRRLKEKSDRYKREMERKLDKWDPHSDPNASGDPYKTLFVARLSYEVTEAKLRREFEVYGPIKKVSMVTDTQGKLRGYGFIEFEHQREMLDAYKHADGKKIYQKRVLVDVERGRTTQDWVPRRLGGGLGGTRRGAPDNCSKYSGREEERTGYLGVDDRKRRYSPVQRERSSRKQFRSRSRSREKERRRSHSPREKKREKRDRSREKDRKKDKDKDKDRDRDKDRERDRDKDRDRGDRDRDRRRDRDKSPRQSYGANESYLQSGIDT